MTESVADEPEFVLDDELFFDDPPRAAVARRHELVREGEVLAGKYRVERIPGRNGLGVLVQVRHVELGQEVTLKFLVPDACVYPEFVQRFIREARAAVKIQGEHVARVTDVGRLESGAPYMVREFLRGPDLSEVVKVRGALPVDEACDYIIQAAEAVAEAHALGIAHRNLRPTTLVVTRRTDGGSLVKVFDFAATEALHVEPFTKRSVSLVGSSALLSSLPYLSPEQVRDPHGVDFRADVYGLGAVLYELLTGLPPFEAESAPALLAMVAADAAAPARTLRPDLPEQLEQIVMRCLAKSRDLRFASVAELALALRPYTTDESAGSIDRIVRLARRGSRPPSLSDARISAPFIAGSPLPSFVDEPESGAGAPREAAPARRRGEGTPAPISARDSERSHGAEPTAAAARGATGYAAPHSPPTREASPPSLRGSPSVPPPLQQAQRADAPLRPEGPAAPSASRTTLRPPAPTRSSISGGLSHSLAAPDAEGRPLPLKKLAMIGLVAACGGFGVVLAVLSTSPAGQSAAGQPIVAARVPTGAVAPAPSPAAPSPELPAAEPVAHASPATAAGAPPVPAVPTPVVVAAPPAAAPVAPPGPRRAIAPTAPRKGPAAAPAAEDAARAAPAKVAGVSPNGKDLFAGPN